MVALRTEELLSEAYVAQRAGGGELSFAELADAPIEALAGLTADDAERLKQTLGIYTIGDLGRHPAIVAAVAIAALAGPARSETIDIRGPVAARLAATREAISRGHTFPPAADVLDELREERLAPW